MYLLNLGQKLQSYRANLSLAEGTFDIGEHIQIASALAMKWCTAVVKAILTFVDVGVQHCWISKILQIVKMLLEALVQ